MKVVINKKHGGFGLSGDARRMLLGLGLDQGDGPGQSMFSGGSTQARHSSRLDRE